MHTLAIYVLMALASAAVVLPLALWLGAWVERWEGLPDERE